MPEYVDPNVPDHARYSELFRAASAQQNLDDYGHAVSGADVGRIQRHGMRVEIDPITGQKKGSAAQRAARTLDWLLANDLLYAQAYEAASGAVDTTFKRAGDILERLVLERDQIADQLSDMLENAATLSDGRKVFMDKNGVVRDADGNSIDDVLAAEIVWTGDEPSYEDYAALQERAEQIDAAINEVRGIETELGGMQGELTDNDTPPDIERLEDIEQRSRDLGSALDDISAGISLSLDSGETSMSMTQAVDIGFGKSAAIPNIPKISGN